MRDKALEGVVALDVVGAKDGQALRLQRDLQLIFRDDHLIIHKWIRAIEGGEEVHHFLLLDKFIQHAIAQLSRRPSARGRSQGEAGKLTYLDRRQVGGHGLAGAVVPARGGTARPAGDKVTIRYHDEGIIGRNDDVIECLGRRSIVAGEPARRAIGLAGHQRTGLGFFPADLAPGGADWPRAAAIANHQLKLRACRNLFCETQAQLPGGLAEFSYPWRTLCGHAPGHHRLA